MTSTAALTVHLIPNAHLDPVWLWDYAEGFGEAWRTVRTVLDLMDERPDLTFIRGESSVYRHLARVDPDAVTRIKAYVAAGRWDVVGGTVVQQDNNLTDTETLLRLFELGARQMARAVGVRPTVAWSADCFGHSAHLPRVFDAVGLRRFAFTRPTSKDLPLPGQLFRWSSPGEDQQVLCFRPLHPWYGTDRDEVPRRLDRVLDDARDDVVTRVGHTVAFLGLGDHGGGPTRRQLDDVDAWRERNPGVRVVYSTLTRFFRAVEASGVDVPSHEGELNFCLRGCYSSALGVKKAYRKAETAAVGAESAVAVASALAGRPVGADTRERLDRVWEGVLFNTFHDILPGTMIESAFAPQLDQLGGAARDAYDARTHALFALAAAADTTVEPPPHPDHPAGNALLVFNPHPFVVEDLVELEAILDHRPIWSYEGRAGEVPLRVVGPGGVLPYQVVDVDSRVETHVPWRRRVVVPMRLPPCGFASVDFGWREGASPPAAPDRPVEVADRSLDNGRFRVEVVDEGLRITRDGHPIGGRDGVWKPLTVHDTWGPWGSLGEDPRSLVLDDVASAWSVADVRVLEDGPWRGAIWVRMKPRDGGSTLDLTVRLHAGVDEARDAVHVHARVLWDERAGRLKLAVDSTSGDADYGVPGGEVRRGAVGEVPGLGWAFCGDGPAGVGFASDALYNFSTTNGRFSVTLVRASRFATFPEIDPEAEPNRPVLDRGEFTVRMLLSGDRATLPCRLAVLNTQPTAQLVAATSGPLGRSASALAVRAPECRVLSLRREGPVTRLRVQNLGTIAVDPEVTWLSRPVEVDLVRPGQIVSINLPT